MIIPPSTVVNPASRLATSRLCNCHLRCSNPSRTTEFVIINQLTAKLNKEQTDLLWTASITLSQCFAPKTCAAHFKVYSHNTFSRTQIGSEPRWPDKIWKRWRYHTEEDCRAKAVCNLCHCLGQSYVKCCTSLGQEWQENLAADQAQNNAFVFS